jgi:hypothetical protein
VGIGALNETDLHAHLKACVAPPGARFEVAVDGYVVDAVADGVLIEVQTRHVGAMRRKLERLLERHPVRLVLPVSVERWIVRRGAGPRARRRSPKRGRPIDALSELVSLPKLLDHRNLEIEVVLVREEEVREHRPGAAYRKRDWVTVERRLLGIDASQRFRGARAWLSVLPPGLPAPFTTADVCCGAGVSLTVAQRAAYVLREAGVLVPAGTRGRSRCYLVAPDGRAAAQASLRAPGASVTTR